MEHKIVAFTLDPTAPPSRRDIEVCSCGAIFRDGRTDAQSNAMAHIQEEEERVSRNVESERMAAEIRGEIGKKG